VPVAVAAGLTIFINLVAGLIAARLHRYGPGPAGNIATTLVARGEFALILAAMAAAAGLDGRLAPFIAGYVLVLAVVGPIMAGRAHWLALALQAVPGLRPLRRAAEAPALPQRRPSVLISEPGNAEHQPAGRAGPGAGLSRPGRGCGPAIRWRGGRR